MYSTKFPQDDRSQDQGERESSGTQEKPMIIHRLLQDHSRYMNTTGEAGKSLEAVTKPVQTDAK